MFRGVLLWLLIMAIETVHGILRGLFLVPWLGELTAGRAGLAIGTVIVLLTTWLLIGWTGLGDRPSLLRLGGLWAVLTFLFEIAIGVARGLDAAGLWAEINPLRGGTMLLGVAVMFVAPLFARMLSAAVQTRFNVRRR